MSRIIYIGSILSKGSGILTTRKILIIFTSRESARETRHNNRYLGQVLRRTFTFSSKLSVETLDTLTGILVTLSETLRSIESSRYSSPPSACKEKSSQQFSCHFIYCFSPEVPKAARTSFEK